MLVVPPLFKHLCDICSSQSSIGNLEQLTSDEWTEILALARRHRVVPAFADGLSTLGFKVPDVISSQVFEENKRNLFNAMRHSAELVKLANLFDTNNIQFLCFKGLALPKLTDQDMASRHSGDIDILLCDRKDVAKADDLLVSAGFRRINLSKEVIVEVIANEYAMEFFRLKDVGYVHEVLKYKLEIHFEVSHLNTFQMTSKELFDNRTEITIGSATIPVMSKADHQLYLLVHGSVSAWFRLKWLLDIPAISNNGKDYFSIEMEKRVSELGIEQMYNQGLWLAHTLLGMPVRDELKNKYTSNKRLRKMIMFANSSIISSAIPEHYGVFNQIKYMACRNIFYFPSLRMEAKYKMACIKTLFVTAKDLEYFPLPSSMFWLYYPLRPVLWLARRIGTSLP